MTLQEVYNEYKKEFEKRRQFFNQNKINGWECWDMEMHIKMCREIAYKMGIELI